MHTVRVYTCTTYMYHMVHVCTCILAKMSKKKYNVVLDSCCFTFFLFLPLFFGVFFCAWEMEAPPVSCCSVGAVKAEP